MEIRNKVRKFVSSARRRGQLTGNVRDCFFVSSMGFDADGDAEKEFLNCKERLLHVSAWSSVTGLWGASFCLYGKDRRPLTTIYPVVGDFLRIDFPETFPVYWLKIDHVVEQENFAEIIAEPIHDPTNREKRIVNDQCLPKSYHVFRVERDGNKIFAVVICATDKQGYDNNQCERKSDWEIFFQRPWKNLSNYFVGRSNF